MKVSYAGQNSADRDISGWPEHRAHWPRPVLRLHQGPGTGTTLRNRARTLWTSPGPTVVRTSPPRPPPPDLIRAVQGPPPPVQIEERRFTNFVSQSVDVVELLRRRPR